MAFYDDWSVDSLLDKGDDYVSKALDGYIAVETARAGGGIRGTAQEQQNWGNPTAPQNTQAGSGGIPTKYLLIGGGVLAVGALAFVFMKK